MNCLQHSHCFDRRYALAIGFAGLLWVGMTITSLLI